MLTLPGRRPWAIEIERRLDPKPARGFFSACGDIDPEARFVVYPGTDRYQVSRNVEAISLDQLLREIVKITGKTSVETPD